MNSRRSAADPLLWVCLRRGNDYLVHISHSHRPIKAGSIIVRSQDNAVLTGGDRPPTPHHATDEARLCPLVTISHHCAGEAELIPECAALPTRCGSNGRKSLRC